MKTNFRKSVGILLIGCMIIPPDITRSASPEIVYPLQVVSKLECRSQNFNEMDSSCKENLKILKPSDYKTYAKMTEGYNDYTRRYSVLWGSSYKYGWDVGNGGHMGVDIATAKGTPVYSMADGEVVLADNKLGFGNIVSVKHTINGKEIISNYAHLSKIDVSVGKKVKAGDKIGEVGSTGNSTGNHLHFQIDLQVGKSPAYYSYDTCPYTYNDIIENGKCFDELKNLTVDPLAFLETSGAILNNITITTVSRPTVTNSDSSKNTNSSSKQITGKASEIFNKQIYIGSSFDDIVEVQKIYRNLGYYNGKIDGEYTSVLASVVKYQLEKGIITSSEDLGAGHFGPKTRAQTQKDYELYLAKNSLSNQTKEVFQNTEIEKISRAGMLTREEIEARELREFEAKYDIKIQNIDVGNSIAVGTNKVISLNITNRNGRDFRGNTPYPITFDYDSNLISVFPEKFYNYTDGKRDITITGKKSGDVNLGIKIGSKTLETIKLRVLSTSEQKNITVKEAVTIISPKVVLGDTNVGAVMLKDDTGHRLINLRYNGKFDLKVEGNGEICVKSGDLVNAKKIVKQECNEYVKSKKITYDDTVGGLLIFNFRIYDRNAKIKLYSYNSKKDLVAASVMTNPPIGLSENYEYYDEIIKMMENSTLSFNLKQGYFLENRNLTDEEANKWIKNTLITMKDNTGYKTLKSKLEANINLIESDYGNSNKNLTRKEFLDKVYKYLIFDKNPQISINYKDLENSDNIKANSVFDRNNTWKDRFGEEYYQPTQTITRGEGAFLLAKAYDRTKVLNVVYAD